MIDLLTLKPTEGFEVIGAGGLGAAVSLAGDVNGDGIDDFLVGAPAEDSNGFSARGAAYLIYGRPGISAIDVANLSGEAGVAFHGQAADLLGATVASAGDINGDGFDDILLGAPSNYGGLGGWGKAYVIFGGDALPASIDMDTLGDAGFVIQDFVGRSMASGDINGDGFHDLAISGGNPHGVSIIFGKTGDFGDIDVSNLGSAGFFIGTGPRSIDGDAGPTVASAGDINGDGFHDVIVGMAGAYSGNMSGKAYVVFGHGGEFTDIDLSAPLASSGFLIQGDIPHAGVATSAAPVGDVNGDGFDDIILGAPGPWGSGPGRAFVILGHAGGFDTINLADPGSAGFTIVGDAAGFSVASAGDGNDDGLNDILIGARLADDGGTDFGKAYLIFGRSAGLAGSTIYLSALSPDQGFIIQGIGQTGFNVAPAGDVDNDGVDDLIVGSPQAQTAHVIYGASALAQNLVGTAGADTLQGSQWNDKLAGLDGDDLIVGEEGNDALDGGAGNDVLVGGTGADVLKGGDGIDTVSYAGSAARVYVRLFNNTAFGGDAGGDTISGFENATGGNGNDDLIGSVGANVLNGGDGDDLLNGHLGNDTLFAGTGVNTLLGGAGDDQFVVNSQADTVTEIAGQGIDTVFASASYTLAADTEIEVLRTTSTAGTAAINLTGNDFSQTIHGNNGANTLYGGLGDDLFYGYGDNDSYFVNGQSDQVVETAGQGSDRVYTSAHYGLAAAAEIEMLATIHNFGTAAINLVGNSIAQTIVGNAGGNTIDGRGGSDTLHGLGGADSFAFRTALGAGNVDRVMDYSVADDRILLDDAVFAGLATGALATGAFNTGAAASQADDRIIYNSATGALLFDADGNGAGAAMHFAMLSTGLAMTAAEFVVI